MAATSVIESSTAFARIICRTSFILTASADVTVLAVHADTAGASAFDLIIVTSVIEAAAALTCIIDGAALQFTAGAVVDARFARITAAAADGAAAAIIKPAALGIVVVGTGLKSAGHAAGAIGVTHLPHRADAAVDRAAARACYAATIAASRDTLGRDLW